MSGRLRGLQLPVVTWKPWLYDDTGMVATGARGTLTASTVTVTAGAPLSGGLSGSTQVTSENQTLPWGTPGSGADIAAAVGTRATGFAYDAGDTRADNSVAASCRAGVTNYHNVAPQFTAAGWTVFDASVEWALNC